jgi:hypothetical protein
MPDHDPKLMKDAIVRLISLLTSRQIHRWSGLEDPQTNLLSGFLDIFSFLSESFKIMSHITSSPLPSSDAALATNQCLSFLFIHAFHRNLSFQRKFAKSDRIDFVWFIVSPSRLTHLPRRNLTITTRDGKPCTHERQDIK